MGGGAAVIQMGILTIIKRLGHYSGFLFTSATLKFFIYSLRE